MYAIRLIGAVEVVIYQVLCAAWKPSSYAPVVQLTPQVW